MQLSPPFSLVTVSSALFVHPNCCNRLLASMNDSLHLQGAQRCLASRRTQTWLTHDGSMTLVTTADTLTNADLLPKGVPQTFSYTGTKDPGNAGALAMLMQEPGEPYMGPKALQLLHCLEQSALHLKLPSGKHSLYAHPMSIINVHTILNSTYTAEALMINGAQCIAHLLRMLVCNMIPLIAVNMALPGRPRCCSGYAHKAVHGQDYACWLSCTQPTFANHVYYLSLTVWHSNETGFAHCHQPSLRTHNGHCIHLCCRDTLD